MIDAFFGPADITAAAGQICTHAGEYTGEHSATCCADCYALAEKMLRGMVPGYASRTYLQLADTYERHGSVVSIVRDLYRRAGVEIVKE